MVNVFAKDGTYMMMKWSHMLMTMETSNQTFVVGVVRGATRARHGARAAARAAARCESESSS